MILLHQGRETLPDEELNNLLRAARNALVEIQVAEAINGHPSINARYLAKALEAFGGTE